MKKIRLFLLLSTVVALTLATAVPVLAQTNTSNLTVQVDTTTFYGAKLAVTADFYVDGVLLGAQVGSLTTPVAPGSHKVEVKNIKPVEISSPPYNLLWRFKDASATTSTSAGKDKTLTVKLQVEALENLAQFTCDVKDWVNEEVLCVAQITNTSTGQNLGNISIGGNMAGFGFDPNDKPWHTQMWLPAGKYSITFSLIGAQSNLWSPASQTKTFTQTVNTNNLLNDKPSGKASVTFKKAGHMIVNMNQPNALGDFYVDGVLVATQVARIDQYVTSSPHKIEIKNITDSTIPNTEQYHWQDAKATVTVGSGQVKTTTVALKKEGNFALPLEYKLPKGAFAEGAHTYTLSYACPGDGFTNTRTFNVSAGAGVVSKDLFMRFSGIERDRLRTGDRVDPINPNQALIALVTLYQRTRAAAEGQASTCSATIAFDGGAAIPLAPATVYQVKP